MRNPTIAQYLSKNEQFEIWDIQWSEKNIKIWNKKNIYFIMNDWIHLENSEIVILAEFLNNNYHSKYSLKFIYNLFNVIQIYL